jgi:pantetheine-phosphate adenylyltransferase
MTKSEKLHGFLPGSFDPPTNGHVDIIRRAHLFCAKLTVGITQNPSKQSPLFTPTERLELVRELFPDLERLELVTFEGLAVDAALRVEANCLIRGIRSASDCEYEFRMATANRKVSGLETLFLMTDERHSHISSTLIRELGSGGRELTAFVPSQIEAKIRKRLFLG